MAAKIIPFPQFMQRHLTLSQGRRKEEHVQLLGEWDTADGIHLVGTGEPTSGRVSSEAIHQSQQEAFRIVREVQQEWNERHGIPQRPSAERSSHFWATLPLPQPERETPLTVARRLVHLLFPTTKTA